LDYFTQKTTMSKMQKIVVPEAKMPEEDPVEGELDDDDIFSAKMNVEEWAGAERLFDTLCPIPGCDGKGDTLFLLNKVPYFRELIIASFCCKKCGGRNNEVTFGGEIQPKGCRIALTVTDPSDLNRQLIKSDSASVVFTEMDFEIPAGTQKGEITTLEGLIKQAADNLNMYQAERMQQMPEVGAKVAMIIMELRQMSMGAKLPFTVVITDTAGNSFIENPLAPKDDPYMKKTEFRRSPEQDMALGLNEQTAGHSDDIKNVEGAERLLEEGESRDKAERENRAEFRETTEGGVQLGHEEVGSLPSPCPNCSKQGEMRNAFTSIPHFKEVLIMAFLCQHCGLRQSEVKAGGAIPTFGTETTLRITSMDDLRRDVLKGEDASISIPELDLQLMGGTLGGVYTTVEGLLDKIYTNLRDNNPFSVGDSTWRNHSNEESTQKKDFKDFLQKMKDLSNGDNFPFTLKIRDALGNSFISGPLGSHLPPEADPNLEMVDFERTEEENDDYGLTDMNTADFETGYENEDKEAVVLPDRLTHVLKKSVDHPTVVAAGCDDNLMPPPAPDGGDGRADGEEGPSEFLEAPAGFSAAKHSAGGVDDPTYFPVNGSRSGSSEVEIGTSWDQTINLSIYNSRQFGDDSALAGGYKAYTEFSGAKEGMVFRLGSLGLGYYPDINKPTSA
jgi:zinc finger protein